MNNTKQNNDRSTFILMLKRDSQGIISSLIAINKENEFKKLSSVAEDLGKLQLRISEYLKNNYKNNEKT